MGVNENNLTDDFLKQINGLKIGSIYKERAYTSTSEGFNIANNFMERQGYFVEVHARKGSRVLVANPEELEFLLDRNTEFKVLDIIENVLYGGNRAHKVIKLEVIPD